MSSRRTLILIGAIAIGAFAAFALLNYVRGVEEGVYEDRQPVDVLIAAQDIPAGTPAAEALTMVEVTQIPLELRPATFIDPSQTDQLAGLLAINDIPANQILVGGLFVDGTVIQQSFKDRIPTGQVAVSVSVQEVAAVGGRLQPGDEVNILVIDETRGCGVEEPGDGELVDDVGGLDNPSGPAEEKLAEQHCTFDRPARYLFQRVEILAIGDREQLQPGEQPDPEGVAAAGGGTITFMVPNEAAQLIASVTPENIYLTLLPEDYEAEQLPALTAEELEGPTPAEDPERLTPYGPDGFVLEDANVAVEGDTTQPADEAEG
ncbi:MAG: Flp pilus assembly protein CpaB [Acidimicrobiales bacterium]